MLKTLSKLEVEGIFLNIIKGIYKKKTLKIISEGEFLRTKNKVTQSWGFWGVTLKFVPILLKTEANQNVCIFKKFTKAKYFFQNVILFHEALQSTLIKSWDSNSPKSKS